MVNSQGEIDCRLVAIQAMPTAASRPIAGQFLAQALVSTSTAVRNECFERGSAIPLTLPTCLRWQSFLTDAR